MKTKDLLDACDGYFLRSELKWKEREPYTPTVYFLTRRGEIVYVGESGWPLGRFKAHTSKTPLYKEWDMVYFKSFDDYVKGCHLRYLEARVMTYLKNPTEYNRVWRHLGDADENPFGQDVLQEYLKTIKKEVDQWPVESDVIY